MGELYENPEDAADECGTVRGWHTLIKLCF